MTERVVAQETDNAVRDDVRITFLGNRDPLPSSLRKEMHRLVLQYRYTGGSCQVNSHVRGFIVLGESNLWQKSTFHSQYVFLKAQNRQIPRALYTVSSSLPLSSAIFSHAIPVSLNVKYLELGLQKRIWLWQTAQYSKQVWMTCFAMEVCSSNFFDNSIVDSLFSSLQLYYWPVVIVPVNGTCLHLNSYPSLVV